MTSGFRASIPTLWHGPGVARALTTHLIAGRSALVVVDHTVRVHGLPAAAADVVEVDASSVDASAVVALAERIARSRPDVVVAAGGGTVLDAAKIAALVLLPARVFEFVLERASAEPVTFLPDAAPPIELLAVPTTLGTSSETNSVGILTNSHGHRLVIGRALVPRWALLDPDHLMTLPTAAVREGALEALLRVAGASTSPRRSARARADAAALGRAILETAESRPDSSEGRLRLARLSAATQRSAALRGPDRYAARHWYVANEVAFVLRARKMAATAATVAAVWQRIADGDARWGDRASLECFWAEVAGALGLPGHPARGIAALVERWRIARPPAPHETEVARIAAVTARTWGLRRPMLAGLDEHDVRDVLHASAWGERRGVGGGDPLSGRGGGHDPRE